MATRVTATRRSKRVVPYDMNLPNNCTVAKLKREITSLGLNLTSKTIPKSALIQIYEQMLTTKNSEQAGTDDNSVPNILETDTNPRNVENRMPADNSMPADYTQCKSVQDLQNNSMMGLFSAMQGTMATLQTTVNMLQQKHNGDTQNNITVTNQLDNYYSSSPQQQQTCVLNAATQYVVPADNLPHIDVVTDNMRRNITSGKYVNLAALLIPDMDATKVSENMGALEFLKRQQKDHRLDRPLSITQFYRAFGIFKRIMCEAYPQRRVELDLYEADIGDIFDHYGEIFYQYHVQFTKKAAAYMEKGIKVDWSKRHKDLFQLLVGGSKTRLCDHCFQADHQSPFCPSQSNVVPSHKQRPNSGPNTVNDKKGRPRISFKGKEICNNFNTEFGCRRTVCSFDHICIKCKKTGHSQVTCQSTSTSGSEPSNYAGPRNKLKPSE